MAKKTTTKKPTSGINARVRAAMADQTGADCPFNRTISDGDNIGEVPIELQATYTLAEALKQEAISEMMAALTKIRRAKLIRETAEMMHGEIDPRAMDMEHMFIGANWQVSFGGKSTDKTLAAANSAAEEAAYRRIFPAADDDIGKSFFESLVKGMMDGSQETLGGLDIMSMMEEGGSHGIDIGDLADTSLGAMLSGMGNDKGQPITDEAEMRSLVADMPAEIVERMMNDDRVPQPWKDFFSDPLTTPVPKGLHIFKTEDGMSVGGTVASVQQVH